ncbi:hypothetical protein [Streptomyces sp. KS_5]|uniref:hypothetical protein n=1 Tax=Streptomyces sp. KS_5 TaxID=1881018 RepID=UPI0008993862|nr:hypothetical protein [Streptomyces sp. KS_5]SEE34212.1 hypothetical protein SAMN05428938_7920 [Streptomyces sp. KS_5]
MTSATMPTGRTRTADRRRCIPARAGTAKTAKVPTRARDIRPHDCGHARGARREDVMPRHQSRAGQRARALQKAAGRKGKYTELLRAMPGPRDARREPAHAEPARRLADRLRADLGADGENPARLIDAAVVWALKDRELKHALLRTQGDLAARARLRPALDEHAAGEVTVHDAPLVQVVYMVLEMAADEDKAASADLLRAAADVLERLVGHGNHIFNPAIHGVRADGWLTEPRMWERLYTTTAPAAVLAAAALRTMREAARIHDEDELTDADCMFTLEEAVRFARTAADLAVRPAA